MATEAAVSAGLAKMMTSNKTETVTFLNDLVAQMWPYVNVAACKLVKDVVEPSFADLPGPLKTLHFEKIDLGPTPFTFDRAVVHKVEDDAVVFEIDVVWDGRMDVEMDADYLPAFGIEHIKVTSRLSVLLHPLISQLPLIGAQQLAFLNPPDIALDFTGAANVADISVVKNAIRGVIDGIIGGMLVLPNRLFIKVDPLCSILDAYVKPLGFVRVKVERGEEFKTTGSFIKDVPDVSCAVSLGPDKPRITRTINNDETPEWNEDFDFILSSHFQNIRISALEGDTLTSSDLGHAAISVSDIVANGGRATLKLQGEDKHEIGPSISVSCKLFNLSSDPSSLRGDTVPSQDAKPNTVFDGLLIILVGGAKNLPGPRDKIAVMAKTMFEESTFQTAVVTDVPGVDVNNPSFDAAYHIPVTRGTLKALPHVTFEVLNHNDKIGGFQVPLSQVLEAPELTLVSAHVLPGGGTFLTQIILNGLAPVSS